MTKKQAPFGAWVTPITSDLALASLVSFTDIVPSVWFKPSKSIVYTESRPNEAGRSALVELVGSERVEVLSDLKWNARTRVHEYGGTCSFMLAEDDIVFSTFEGPVYRVRKVDSKWGTPEQITPKSDVLRYADLSAHPSYPNILFSVLEDHTVDLPSKVVNTLTLIDFEKSTLHPLAAGADFYSAPRVSRSGKYVTWVQWNHPDMPWEGSELWVAELARNADGSLNMQRPLVEGTSVKIAGAGGGKESVSQPRWGIGNEDILVFLSDRSGFSQLYQWTPTGSVEQFLKELENHDVGSPDWTFGNASHTPLSPTQWISRRPSGQLLVTDLQTKDSKVYETGHASIVDIKTYGSEQEPQAIAIVAPTEKSPVVSVFSFLPLFKESIVSYSSKTNIDSAYFSHGKRISYPTSDGGKAYGIYYPPANKEYEGVNETLPPLIAKCHGGPTSSAPSGFSLAIQFWTSRGFAVVDVDYAGSTGYGRVFRKKLDKQWGVADVSDTVDCVNFFAKNGEIDSKRVAITGGSAGGFTVLGALAKSATFTAGVSYYGVSDLNLLAGDTHKFESQYLFNLLGGTPEDIPEVYKDRSPITHCENIVSPLLLLQGDIDRVVPPAQSTEVEQRIKANGGVCELVMFEGEGHGFRKAENKTKAVETELDWYLKTWKIE